VRGGDWSAPLEEGKGFLLERRCSLHGTELWQQLSPAQRLELGKHEAASVASLGIWLEFVLLRMLAKLTYHGDPASRHVQSVARLSRAELPYHRALLAHIAFTVASNLINPAVYRSVGLDPRAARRAALENPGYQQTLRFGGEKVVAFLADAGLIGAPGMHWWRRSFLVG
jgi:hypothetical protein